MNLLDALQQALAAEHRAVYLYSYAGGRARAYVGKALAARCFAEWRQHQELRSWLEAEISGLGAQPVAADLVYPVHDVTSAHQVRAVAQEAEKACLLTWLAVIAAADPDSQIRDKALTSFTEAGLRGVSFGADAQALPGIRPGAASPVTPSPSSS